MAIRITYDSKTIDLNIATESIQVEFFQDFKQNRSGSGKIETINNYGIQLISFSAQFQEAIYRDLIAWWSYCRQGQSFAFAFDSDNVSNTTLDASAASGQKTVPLTATTGLASTEICLIKAVDLDNEFEIVVINSVSAGVSIATVENLKFSYTATDIFRHWHYWPSVINLDSKFNPKKDGSWYSWKFNFAEAL